MSADMNMPHGVRSRGSSAAAMSVGCGGTGAAAPGSAGAVAAGADAGGGAACPCAATETRQSATPRNAAPSAWRAVLSHRATGNHFNSIEHAFYVVSYRAASSGIQYAHDVLKRIKKQPRQIPRDFPFHRTTEIRAGFAAYHILLQRNLVRFDQYSFEPSATY
ncbi:MAG TPA: hypothetical protein VN795_02440 [Stellaceae bacterium]|nr:hypothetical protein [Stellaceae bacterium]